MATSDGFGKKDAPKISKSAAKRSDAAKQFDKMKADGLPEFTIFIRVKDQKNWFPVGSIAAKRSMMINHAIFDQQAELLQGALRLFPMLRKHQQNLEYGYRLKEFSDEPIQLAVRPAAGAGNFLKSAIDRVAGLLKR